ncbi:MAG: HAMP domain-containing histidine kinase [Lachnospiraceae bacterium]|nr:HAMP domain-containing histidine kinase [Lachnospiraceae bacterium]
MSENNDKKHKKESKKTSSIAKKLSRQLTGKKWGLFIGADLFLFIALSLGWMVEQEINTLGNLVWDRYRVFHIKDGISSLTYEVSYGGEELINVNAYNAFIFIIGVVCVAFIFQMLDLIFSHYAEYMSIKKTLKPLDELALKADKISRMSFDEDKFHLIEDAITHINPEDEKTLSLGNEDLRGIETAMNNLLKRMHDTYNQQARFVNDASHELRTPIAVIQGYANMLDRWGKEDESVLDESIAAIKNESEHMNHLVEQLLFLARGDSGRNVMNFEDISLNEMMKEIYEESLMIDEEHPYRFSDSDENIRVNADASMLKQAVRILVDNAAKYTQKGDEIKLSVGRNEYGRPYLQVQDSGIGMAEADVQHMFERFYRSDEVRKTQGTGLGLSISKWIVDKHKGHFEILSRTELGTRIRIVL